jgi:hypothetical protein
VTFTVEGDSVEQQAGAVVMIPRGVMHTYTNTGDEPSRLIATFALGGFDRFLVELYERAFVMPDDMPAFVQLAAEYGVEIPPPQADDRHDLIAVGWLSKSCGSPAVGRFTRTAS